MSDYTKQLEEQNENLKQLLAEAQTELVIINRRHTERLRFRYFVCYDIGTTRSVEATERYSIEGMLGEIRQYGIKDYIHQHHHSDYRNATHTVSVYIHGWRRYRKNMNFTVEKKIFEWKVDK